MKVSSLVFLSLTLLFIQTAKATRSCQMVYSSTSGVYIPESRLSGRILETTPSFMIGEDHFVAVLEKSGMLNLFNLSKSKISKTNNGSFFLQNDSIVVNPSGGPIIGVSHAKLGEQDYIIVSYKKRNDDSKNLRGAIFRVEDARRLKLVDAGYDHPIEAASIWKSHQ